MQHLYLGVTVGALVGGSQRQFMCIVSYASSQLKLEDPKPDIRLVDPKKSTVPPTKLGSSMVMVLGSTGMISKAAVNPVSAQVPSKTSSEVL